jgi:hypothetical protein
VAAANAAMGLDLDLEDGGIRGAADRGEGAATAVAVSVGAGDLVFFGDHGQVRVVAAAWSRLAALLTTRPARWGVGGRRHGRGRRGAGLGLAAEELLLAQTQLGAEVFVLLAEQRFAFDSALVLGLPITGLPPGRELNGEAWADGTGTIREGRRGTSGGERRGGQGNPR